MSRRQLNRLDHQWYVRSRCAQLKYLFTASVSSESKNRVDTRSILDSVVVQRAIVLQLLTRKNQSLVIRGNAYSKIPRHPPLQHIQTVRNVKKVAEICTSWVGAQAHHNHHISSLAYNIRSFATES